MRDTVSRASFVKSHERMRGSSRRLEAPTYVFAEMRYVARPRHWPIDVRRVFLSLSRVRLQLSIRDPDLLHRRFSGNVSSPVHSSICFFLFPLFSLLWHRYITVFLRVIVLAPCRAMPTLLDDVRGFRLHVGHLRLEIRAPFRVSWIFCSMTRSEALRSRSESPREERNSFEGRAYRVFYFVPYFDTRRTTRLFTHPSWYFTNAWMRLLTRQFERTVRFSNMIVRKRIPLWF